nr:MAG TPA: hypothetical protein [Bacteriophage sp.]
MPPVRALSDPASLSYYFPKTASKSNRNSVRLYENRPTYELHFCTS